MSSCALLSTCMLRKPSVYLAWPIGTWNNAPQAGNIILPACTATQEGPWRKIYDRAGGAAWGSRSPHGITERPCTYGKCFVLIMSVRKKTRQIHKPSCFYTTSIFALVRALDPWRRFLLRVRPVAAGQTRMTGSGVPARYDGCTVCTQGTV